MATLKRNFVIRDGERISPSKLNSLITETTVEGLSSEDLGTSLGGVFYGDTDPGVTYGRIWWDTTAAAPEGLKVAFVTPSNASLASWLYRTPRTEAYFWTATRVSLGTPLYLSRRRTQAETTNEMMHELYDGYAFPYVYPSTAAHSSASEASPYVIVALESAAADSPVKCAWSGIVPCIPHETHVSLGHALHLDYTRADKLAAGTLDSGYLTQLHGVVLHETDVDPDDPPQAFLLWGSGAGYQDITP